MATLRKRYKPNGFTIVELFVVLLILGILSAIILPSFLAPSRDCRSHVEQYVGTLIRSQQAYFLEQSRFAESIEQSGAPLSENANYVYSSDNRKTRVFIYAKAQKTVLKSAVGGVFLRQEGKVWITEGIVCVAQRAGIHPIVPAIDARTCGEGTIKHPRTKKRG